MLFKFLFSKIFQQLQDMWDGRNEYDKERRVQRLYFTYGNSKETNLTIRIAMEPSNSYSFTTSLAGWDKNGVEIAKIVFYLGSGYNFPEDEFVHSAIENFIHLILMKTITYSAFTVKYGEQPFEEQTDDDNNIKTNN